ncbi:hypothetical protein Cantr_03400 [Candida viswanathii]|uniref:Uncharacterized protein n=1 Tax=Candida viswanathii TaxID=5486 RepID=A0A367YM96_9ASCO|nr:hypothetical protein Cantr_03400 [Candida viswanathii]
MTSRLRKFDKSILSQTTEYDDNARIDTQDQTELIDRLSASNREAFRRYTRYLTGFYVFQICLISGIQLARQSRDVTDLLLTLCVLLNLISVNYAEFKKVIRVMCVLVSVQLTGIGVLLKRNDVVLLCVVPWFNTITPYVFNYWFTSMDELVSQLNKLKYEYKNV